MGRYMGLILIFLAFIHAIADHAQASAPFRCIDGENENACFEKFIKEFNKNYSATEKKIKKQIFIKNLQELKQLENVASLAQFELNQHSDQDFNASSPSDDFESSQDETTDDHPSDTFLSRLFQRIFNFNQSTEKHKISTMIDWRKSGCIGPARDQKKCGSCWALTTNAIFESLTCLFRSNQLEPESVHIKNESEIKTNPRLNPTAENPAPNQHPEFVRTSASYMIDCVKENYGCNGGEVYFGIKQINTVSKGNLLDHVYPTIDEAKPCPYNDISNPLPRGSEHMLALPFGYQIKYESVPRVRSTAQLRALLEKGPVPISIAGNSLALRHYKGGVLEDPEGKYCPADRLNHAVVCVGYGTVKGGKVGYFTILNSWSPAKGEGGYYRLRASDEEYKPPGGTCGIFRKVRTVGFEAIEEVVEG